VRVDSQAYYYKVIAEDSCTFKSNESNIGRTMVLSAINTKNLAEISWDPYEFWPEGIEYYEVQVYNEFNMSYMPVNTVSKDSTFYIDNETNLNQPSFCYRVGAYRNGDRVPAFSNRSCVPVSFGCWMPTAFSPNGDGFNDSLRAVGASVFRFHLVIFDRWGQTVFESYSIDNGWDGTINGMKAPDGYYYYYLQANGTKRNKKKEHGTVLLFR
jgi:gliding motility-associated-like protein